MGPLQNPAEIRLGVRARLEALGYRLLPQALWPSGVMEAYRNDQGDCVVVIENLFEGLELRPADYAAVG